MGTKPCPYYSSILLFQSPLMRNRLLLFCLFALSLLLSTPSLVRLPRFLPFIHADARRAAVVAIEDLRRQGFWLVNVDLVGIARKTGGVCFLWEERYTSRAGTAPPKLSGTCIPTPV